MGPEYYRKYMSLASQELRGKFGDVDLEVFYNGIRRAVNNLENENSPKIKWVLDRIRARSNGRFVVFSHWLEAGNRLVEMGLRRHDIPFAYINGSLSQAQRNRIVEDYNEGRVRVLLISKAGGEGLDLKRTTDVVIMEPGWNKASIDQVIGRAVRYGSHSEVPPARRRVDLWNLYMVTPKDHRRLRQILADEDQEQAKEGQQIEDEDIESGDLVVRRINERKQKRLDRVIRTLVYWGRRLANCPAT
jgi:superfamily II DNA/RNA helicase